jgi:hypothetical protein
MTVEVVEVVAAPPVVSAPVDSAPVQPPADNPPPVSSAPVVVEQPVVVVPADNTVPPTAELPAGVVPIPTAIEVVPTVELPTAIPPTDVIPTVEVVAPTQVVPTDVVPTAESSGQSSRDVPAAPPPTLSGPIKPAPTAEVPAVQPTDVSVPVQPTEVAPVIIPTVEVIAPTAGVPAEIPAVQPTTVPVEANPAVSSAKISGVVSFQDAEDFTGITVLLTLPDGTQLQNVTGAAGTFEFLNLKPGTYKVVASAQGYLARAIDVTLTDGQAMVLPSTFLVGGDTNFDNVIDLNDAVLIASNFDGPATVQTADPNRDGWIDVRDLALIGADYGLTGPIPWQ